MLVCASVSACAESHRQTGRCEMTAKQVSWSNGGASYHKVRERAGQMLPFESSAGSSVGCV